MIFWPAQPRCKLTTELTTKLMLFISRFICFSSLYVFLGCVFLEGLVPVTEGLAVAAVLGPAGNVVAAENEIVASAELETKTGHETELKTKRRRKSKTRKNKGNTFFLCHLNF